MPTAPKEPDVQYASRAVQHVKRVCAGRLADAAEILPLAKALGVFESTSPWSHVDAKGFVALLNDRLMALGLDPFLPDYATMKLETAMKKPAPEKPVCVVIVDDDVGCLLQTALVLVGWPGVDTVLYRYRAPDDSEESAEISKEDAIHETAERVAALKPDVVLMDEGLCGPFSGHDLVPAIRALTPNTRFVANTGGSPGELNRAGAAGNCNKGRSLRDVERAVLSCD